MCSSLEASLVFAGAGLMAAVVVSAALAVSAVKHRSAQYCAWIAAAQCCSFYEGGFSLNRHWDAGGSRVESPAHAP